MRLLIPQFNRVVRYFGRATCLTAATPERRIARVPNSNPLVDEFSRFHSYLRISLTERCNLRCHYCMPEEGVNLQPNAQILTTDEIVCIARVFASQGVDKVRLTGGEPTVRKELVEIVRRIRDEAGIQEIGMTTNGIALTRKLNALVSSGLNRLNISLDTLREEKYVLITRRNGYRQVMRAIDEAEFMFDRVKINCVVIRGVNDEEVVDFVRFTRDRNLDVRFIEYMPFGGNKFETKKMVSYQEMLKKISVEFDDRIIRLRDKPNDTSKAYKVDGFKGQFGFISSMSEHFCATCNRLRVTADGNLKVCLHGNAEVSLRDRIRSNATDAELLEVIGSAVQRKKSQHAGMEILSQGLNRPMILIGAFFLLSTRHFSSTPVYQSEKSQLTHVDSRGRISMVDIDGKQPTTRIALATSTIQLTEEIMSHVLANTLKKGDIRAVSQFAGIMAAKQTAQLIPLCHNIPLSDVQVRVLLNKVESQVFILCRAKSRTETGVEMEALVGASVAALTLYDMCKAVSHDMIVSQVRLLGKRGGKRDFGIVEFADVETSDLQL